MHIADDAEAAIKMAKYPTARQAIRGVSASTAALRKTIVTRHHRSRQRERILCDPHDRVKGRAG